MSDKELDGFEKREQLGDAYWKDKRWQEVYDLRAAGKHLEANSLVMQIRQSWGV